MGLKMEYYQMKTHFSFPQHTLSASNHSATHTQNSEYQILEPVDWLHPVYTIGFKQLALGFSFLCKVIGQIDIAVWQT